jgi:calcium homeostasis ER protein
MSAPTPPQDIQLMNIIDKLANFVARNGTEFEQLTFNKQINNAKFSFLRPGEEFYNYYQYKLMECRRRMR